MNPAHLNRPDLFRELAEQLRLRRAEREAKAVEDLRNRAHAKAEARKYASEPEPLTGFGAL